MKYNFLLHLHPRKIKADAIKFKHTFGLGGMAALLITIQVISGLLLKYHYIPNPAEAYNSILHIQNNLMFGQLIRNLHHWSAIFLIWISFLHLLRVVFTAAFYKPRNINWYIGVGLLVLIILSNFTGYLLTWDQLSYWAIKISTNLIEYIPFIGNSLKEIIIGGSEINEKTLSNFYNFHTGFIPLLLVLLVLWHFWKVRRAGGVILSEEAKTSPSISTNPNLIAREAVVALVLIAALLFLSVFFDANLLERADPFNSPNPAKAPWYFMGFQEMLIHFNPVIVVTLLPILLFGFFIFMPMSKTNGINKGVWFSSEKGKKTVILFSIISFIFSVLLVLSENFFKNTAQTTNSSSFMQFEGIAMFLIFNLIFGGSLFFFYRKYKLNAFEIIQLVIASTATIYIVFSIVGIFFRGEGMQLYFKW